MDAVCIMPNVQHYSSQGNNNRTTSSVSGHCWLTCKPALSRLVLHSLAYLYTRHTLNLYCELNLC